MIAAEENFLVHQLPDRRSLDESGAGEKLHSILIDQNANVESLPHIIEQRLLRIWIEVN